MGAMRVHRAGQESFTARAPTAAWGSFDVQLAFFALALAVVGLLMAYTNSAGEPLAVGSTFTRALMWFALAMVAFTVAAAFDFRWLRTFAWALYAINIGMLLVTLAIGTGPAGVRRWIEIGPFTLQFSELAKVVMVAVLAAYLAARRDRLNRLTTLLGAGVLMAPPFALVLIQPDLGTSLVFAAIVIGMVFLAGVALRWLGLAAAVGLAAMPIGWSILEDYQRRRLLTFLDPTADALGSGFQVLQSQFAVASGGMFGRGLTSGGGGATDLLPVASTDFSAAVLFAELGFVGGLVVFGLFVGLIWRVLVVGWRSNDVFGVAFAAGIASMLLFQLVVNGGMVMGIMPVTGIPFPFVTHGGSSLISIAVGLGVLQSINMRRSARGW